jgi:Ni,Fe-hydrogenase maturation factor
MSGERKEDKGDLLVVKREDLEKVFEEKLSSLKSMLESLKPKEKEEKKSNEVLVKDIMQHAVSCPECSEPLNKFVSERLDRFKTEIEKLVEEKVKSLAKKEERRGGLFE